MAATAPDPRSLPPAAREVVHLGRFFAVFRGRSRGVSGRRSRSV